MTDSTTMKLVPLQSCESYASVTERVRDLMAKQFKMDPIELVDRTLLLEELGVSSLQVMALVIKLERQFALVVPEEDIRALATLGDVFEYVERCVATAQSRSPLF